MSEQNLQAMRSINWSEAAGPELGTKTGVAHASNSG
jgi:hypothetical protein